MEAQIFDPNLPLRILDFSFLTGMAFGICLSFRSVKSIATLKLTPEQRERRLSIFDVFLHLAMAFMFSVFITVPFGFFLSSENARFLFGGVWTFLSFLYLATKIQKYTVMGSTDINPVAVAMLFGTIVAGIICGLLSPSVTASGSRCSKYECAQYLE